MWKPLQAFETSANIIVDHTQPRARETASSAYLQALVDGSQTNFEHWKGSLFVFSHLLGEIRIQEDASFILKLTL